MARIRNAAASVQFWWEPDGTDLYLYLNGVDGLGSRSYGYSVEYQATQVHFLSLFAVLASEWPPDLVGEYPLGSDGLHLSFSVDWEYDLDGGPYLLAGTWDSWAGTYAAGLCLSRVWPDRLSGTVTFTSLDGWPLTPVDVYVEFDVMGDYIGQYDVQHPGNWSLYYQYFHTTEEAVWDPAYWHAPVGGASP